MAVKQYDPNQMVVIFSGIPIAGFGDGAFVSIAMNNDSFGLVVGTDGESVRSKSNDRSARITVTTMQTSTANAALQALHNLDLNTDGGAGIGPMQISDVISGDVYSAETAWLTKTADAEFDRTATGREYIFETDKLDVLLLSAA